MLRNDDLRKRVGRIEISIDIMNNLRELMACFKSVLVTDIRHHQYKQTVEFIGFSDNFDIVEEGQTLPSYRIEMECPKGEVTSVKFIRID